MKKILFFALLLVMSRGAYAQTATLTIINASNSTIELIMHAGDNTIYPYGGCSTWVSYTFTIPPLTTYVYSPCDVETVAGWYTKPRGSSQCPGGYTAGFQWTAVDFIRSSTCMPPYHFVGTIGDIGAGCATAYSATFMYCSSEAAYWSPATGAPLSNVTIQFTP